MGAEMNRSEIITEFSLSADDTAAITGNTFEVLIDSNVIFEIEEDTAPFILGYTRVAIDISGYAVGSSFKLKFKGKGMEYDAFSLDDVSIKVGTGSDFTGDPFTLSDVVPDDVFESLGATLQLSGDFGASGTTYDASSLQVCFASSSTMYDYDNDVCVAIDSIDATTDGTLIYATLPSSVTFGDRGVYITGLRGGIGNDIRTGIVPLKVTEVEYRLDSVTPVQVDGTPSALVTLRGDFKDADPATLVVKFQTPTTTYTEISPQMNTAQDTITVMTPDLNPIPTQIDGQVYVEATVNAVPASQTGMQNFSFLVPEAILPPLGDCSPNLIQDPSFEVGSGSSFWTEVTGSLIERKWRDPGEEPKLHLFGQLKRITKQWLDSYLICKGNTYPAQLVYQELADMACEKITAAITRHHSESTPIKAVLDPYNPMGSTNHVNFNTSKTDRYETDSRKSHVNWVVLDSGWEGEFCRVAESHPNVRAYVKNHSLGLEVPVGSKNSA